MIEIAAEVIDNIKEGDFEECQKMKEELEDMFNYER